VQESVRKKQDEQWKKWLVVFFLLACVWIAYDRYYAHGESSGVVTQDEAAGKIENTIFEPIEKQLKALQAHNFSGAYEEVSALDFKKQTTLDKFRAYIESYPIFSSFKNYHHKTNLIDKTHAEAVVELNPDKENIALHYKLVKEDGQWKVWSMQIILPLNDTTSAVPLEHPRELIPVVEGQLEAIKSKQDDRAYEQYTSASFKKISSLDVFKEFLKKYPIFADHQEAQIQESLIENGSGKVVVTLKNTKEERQALFMLEIEDGKWKVEGIQLLSAKGPSAEEPAKEFDSKPLTHLIELQLAALKKKDIKAAYDEYSSQEFKETTPFKDFEEFVAAHPVFMNNASGSFPKLTFDNNIATLLGSLISTDGVVYPVEYDLIMNDHQWKILHIEIESPRQVDEKSH